MYRLVIDLEMNGMYTEEIPMGEIIEIGAVNVLIIMVIQHINVIIVILFICDILVLCFGKFNSINF